MATALYPPLLSALCSLTQSISDKRLVSPTQPTPLPTSLPALPSNVLKQQIQTIWDTASSSTGYGKSITPTGADSASSSSGMSSRKAEVLRAVLDLIGRDLVIKPILQKEIVQPVGTEDIETSVEFQTSLQDRLDITLTLYEVVYESFPDIPLLEPGAVFIPLLEDLVELISQASWYDLWTYVETRSKRFTKDMPASKGKALPLLRTINSFLRTLPRTPEGLVFRGRVHQFASSVIGIADKSAINMRGDYNDIKTTWEVEVEEGVKTEEDEEKKEEPKGDPKGEEDEDIGDDRDVKMKETTEGDGKEASKESRQKAESEFYSTLWSLQQFFANPPSLDGPPVPTGKEGEPFQTPFEQFRTKTDFILPKLYDQTKRERELRGKEQDSVGKKRKRVISDNGSGPTKVEEESFFYPRYLTGKRLLQHEIADPSFRRQILVQYFILFQFLLNLTPASATKQLYTGGMPKTFVIDGDNQLWIKNTVSSIREELRKMAPDGQKFEETVVALMDRERRYAQWKNEQCPEGAWEIPPLDKGSAVESAELWKRRLAPPPQYPFKLGSRSLSRLWNRGFQSIEQLKGWKRSATVQSLDEEIQKIEADEEDDKAMGNEPPAENKERKINLTWRALRIAAHTDLRHFAALTSKRDLHLLVKNTREASERVAAAAAGQGDSGAGAGGDEEDKMEEDEADVAGLKKDGSREATEGLSMDVEGSTAPDPATTTETSEEGQKGHEGVTDEAEGKGEVEKVEGGDGEGNVKEVKSEAINVEGVGEENDAASGEGEETKVIVTEGQDVEMSA